MKPAKIAKELRIGVDRVYKTIFNLKRTGNRVLKKAKELA